MTRIDEKTTSIYHLFSPKHQDLIKTENSPIHHQKPIELRTKPSKSLIFSPPSNFINFKFYNDNSFPLIFKLKTTQPDILASQPARGFIPANSSIECHLTPLETKYRISLVIQYAQILNEYDDYLTQWKNLKSENILIKKYQCTFRQQSQLSRPKTLVKPLLFTFATITLLTMLIYFRNK